MGVLTAGPIVKGTAMMRSHGLSFVVLLALAIGSLAPDAAAPVTAESRGSYRVEARASGLEFSSARGASLEFGRARLCARSETLEPSPVAPRRDGERIRYADRGWSEEYWLRDDAVEQVFVIDRPIREEVEIRFPVRSLLRPVALDARTIAFADADGRNRMLYKDALVLDAAGHMQNLRVSVEDGELALHLPKDYMTAAVFPVVVDPLVGTFETLSPAGGLWRIPGVHLAWNSVDRIYLSVWHQDIVFNSSTTQPPHNWLNGSIIRARAIKVNGAGGVEMGDPITAGKPYVGVTLGPVTAGDAAFGPRVRHNPIKNEFMVVWSEGQWTDGTIFGSAVTDMDNNGIGEYSYAQDPYPSNSRIVARRVTADPLSLAVSTVPESTVEVSMGIGGTTANPSGTDTAAIHPSILPDVSWDGVQYVVTWQTLESPVIGAIENANPGYQYRHVFRSQGRARYRLYGPTGSPLSTFVDLSNAKERFFIKGPTGDPANIVDGSVPANLRTELTYNSVPTDPSPHVDSLIIAGPDNRLGTGDDINVGSLMTWNVTSLVFNQGKSRVRGRFLPAGTNTPGIIWDVISPPTEIVQRAYVAAGAGTDLASSSFLVAFETVEDVVRKGTQKVEFVGSLAMRLTDAQGQPIGGTIDVALSEPAANRFYLGPTLTWCAEARQYLVGWTETDTMWNPVTLAVSWHPSSFLFRDAPTAFFGTIATAYPVAASPSYSSAIDPADISTADHHILFAGQEDDFGANYMRRYKFIPVAGTPGGGPGPSGGGGGGGGSGGGGCGVGQAAVGGGAGSILALAGAILLALFPGLGRTLRPRARK
jgi:hypothetical protein